MTGHHSARHCYQHKLSVPDPENDTPNNQGHNPHVASAAIRRPSVSTETTALDIVQKRKETSEIGHFAHEVDVVPLICMYYISNLVSSRTSSDVLSLVYFQTGNKNKKKCDKENNARTAILRHQDSTATLISKICFTAQSSQNSSRTYNYVCTRMLLQLSCKTLFIASITGIA